MSRLSAYIRACFHHENYHGWYKRSRYFEGWYLKLISRNGQHAIALIPGIAMDDSGARQAFIQVLDGKAFTARYHVFDPDFFKPNKKRFKLKIQDNSFSLNRIKVQLPELQGQIHFTEHALWPKKIYQPGIMGWYSFVPGMECYHQVISLDCNLTGKLLHHGAEIDFTGGRGYIEKDWGRSFPSAWIWMQSNHFTSTEVSFKLSVARIPWMGSSFIGFICAFYIKGNLIKFASYTGAKLEQVELHDSGVHIRISDRKQILQVRAEKSPGAELLSPILGLMEGRVSSALQGLIHITLQDKKENRVIFNDTGRYAGMEIAGNTHELLNF